jgi:hypothetical protein
MKQKGTSLGRMPTLSTILMVEKALQKSHRPLPIPRLKEELPKQVMHQTLLIILEYLWDSKKIEYTPGGIRWIFK